MPTTTPKGWDPPLMQCGHAANARDEKTGKWVCVICLGINPGAEIVCSGKPNLSGRSAQCVYGDRTTASALTLPFFKHCPNQPYDEYYCGCHGWE